MQFYNPFKPHIINQNGFYSIRKYEIFFGFRYWDYTCQWWTIYKKHFNEATLEIAIKSYQDKQESNKKDAEKMKISKKSKFIKYL